MTDSTNNQPAASKKPSHIAYQVQDREGEKGFFTPIGAMWPHAKGKGFTLQLRAIPLDGRIVLFTPKEKPE